MITASCGCQVDDQDDLVDVEWEGDYQQQVAQINRAVRELPEMRGR